VTIRDYGVGLGDTKNNPQGYGLGNIAARLKDIGGRAKIENAEPGPGVQVILDLPLRDGKNLSHGKNKSGHR
jgi:signal transduction histidine kinase